MKTLKSFEEVIFYRVKVIKSVAVDMFVVFKSKKK